MKRFESKSCTRVSAAAMAAFAVLLLQGCAGDSGKCLEYADRPYQVEVCDRYSNTGSCAARHWETKTRRVCVKWDKSKS